jgi:hypothetical protein
MIVSILIISGGPKAWHDVGIATPKKLEITDIEQKSFSKTIFQAIATPKIIFATPNILVLARHC